jgi:hypothetical protein
VARRLVRWHPIYIEPIEGSAERLTIAIAGGTAEEVRFKMIEGFRETFGPKIEAALAARRPMLDAVADALRSGPVDLLASVDSLGPGLFVGAARQVMTSDIDAALEAAARITSAVFNADRNKPELPSDHWNYVDLGGETPKFDPDYLRAAVCN